MDDEEEEEAISRIVAELEDSRHHSLPSPPISDSSLSDLRSLLSGDGFHRLCDELSAKSMSPATILNPLSSAMDSDSPSLSVAAAKVYLSLILCPNSPVFTLFTPMAFHSLLHSVRRYVKRRPEMNSGGGQDVSAPTANRKRRGRGGAAAAKRRSRSDRDEAEIESEFDVRVLCSVLESLGLAMGLIHLDRFPDSLKALIQTVCEILALVVEFCPNLSNYNILVELCYKILVQVLRPEHGEEANSVAEVLKDCITSNVK